jgi:hypothetical protein
MSLESTCSTGKATSCRVKATLRNENSLYARVFSNFPQAHEHRKYVEIRILLRSNDDVTVYVTI